MLKTPKKIKGKEVLALYLRHLKDFLALSNLLLLARVWPWLSEIIFDNAADLLYNRIACDIQADCFRCLKYNQSKVCILSLERRFGNPLVYCRRSGTVKTA